MEVEEDTTGNMLGIGTLPVHDFIHFLFQVSANRKRNFSFPHAFDSHK